MMLNNLKAEFARKGLRAIPAVMEALGLSANGAGRKIRGEGAFTFPEALTIKNTYFAKDEHLTLEFLFANFAKEGQGDETETE